MPYPSIYDVTYSYTGFQQSQGDNSFPGTQLDADLAGLDDSISNLALFMQGVMRSDGALQNGIVTYDSLSSGLQTAGLTPAAAWLTGVNYLVNANAIQNGTLYRSTVTHTSGVFATDLAAGKWVLVIALPIGPQGPSGTIAVNGTTTLAAGSPATVANVGTAQAALLNFGIPQGPQGNPGNAATVAAGSTTTLAAGSAATVTNVGTAAAAVFNFGVPKGADGIGDTTGPAASVDGEIALFSGVTGKILKRATAIGGVLKAAAGVLAQAVAGTDYVAPGTATAFTAQQGFTLATLTDAATIAWNVAAAQKAKVTLGGNRTMGAVTNAVEGTTYSLWAIQDATGSRTITWTTTGAGSFDFGSLGAPTLTTTLSQADLLVFEAITIAGTLKLRYMGIKKGFS